MLPKYFQQELSNLRELGSDFAKAHPSLAPMLSGTRADPDVERLLEGSAFLTALLRQKLDDEFPEIVHDLFQIIAPQYLRPFPSTTIQAFSPKTTVRNSVKIPKEIFCASVPVEGTSCLFQTRYETELHPLTLTDASFSYLPGKPSVIKLSFELNGLNLSQWKPETVRLFLADEYARAADLYLFLRRHLKSIKFIAEGGKSTTTLSKTKLKPVGLDSTEMLIPSATNSYPGYGFLQEYFILPQKFLFLDLTGWEEWRARGTGSKFEVHLELSEPPFLPTRLSKNSFVLHATPAVNIYPQDADPISLDHRKTHYAVRPSNLDIENDQVYSVEEVKGFQQGTSEERTYLPFDLFRPTVGRDPVYHLTRRPSPVTSGVDMFLSVEYPPQEGEPVPETLSLRLTCTNGPLPSRLKPGDISIHARGCPEYVTFRNLTAPTPGLTPPVGKNMLWRLLSHLSTGFQSLEKLETLKSMLELYIFPDSPDYSTLANQKRIDGIKSVAVAPADRLISGAVMRGREITLTLREDHFASRGDMFLFGCVLDSFFANYASINSFTSLVVKEVSGGTHYTWPARMGNRRLV